MGESNMTPQVQGNWFTMLPMTVQLSIIGVIFCAVVFTFIIIMRKNIHVKTKDGTEAEIETTPEHEEVKTEEVKK